MIRYRLHRRVERVALWFVALARKLEPKRRHAIPFRLHLHTRVAGVWAIWFDFANAVEREPGKRIPHHDDTFKLEGIDRIDAQTSWGQLKTMGSGDVLEIDYRGGIKYTIDWDRVRLAYLLYLNSRGDFEIVGIIDRTLVHEDGGQQEASELVYE